ncbi:MAG TPA: ATP-binding protein [Dehalococcoidia bacterium]|nr:ATP-binding protein [Dehalococcoidia bacterium]
MPELSAADLRPACDPSIYTFETTAEVPPYVGLIGQDRAVQALRFGLTIQSKGFNICVAGEPGTGRTTAVLDHVQEYARRGAVPQDWCYVYNFRDPSRPNALGLPPGRGRELCVMMATMVQEAKDRVPRTFTSEDFINRRDEILSAVQRHRDVLFSQLAAQARQNGFLLQGNPAGFFLVPLLDGKPMDDQAFAGLSDDERAALLQKREALMAELRMAMKQEEGVEAAAMARLAELEHNIAAVVADALIEPLKEHFAAYPEVVEYLAEVRDDMVENIALFQPQAPPPHPAAFPPQRDSGLRRYEVNLLIDHTRSTHAPVVHETNPSPGHLLGRIEKEAVFGALVTDFTMIRPGSLHRANGGFLILNADDLLANPVSYVELKRVLRTGQLTIEELGERLGYLETKTVRPEPIPWTGKVICLAREEVYRVLYTFDPEFRELFKVKADFDMHIDRTPEHQQAYASLISAVARKEELPHLDAAAVARVVEEGMRMVEDQQKLSVRFGDLLDIVREAAFWARSEGQDVVRLPHIQRAVQERIYRVNLIEEHVREAVQRGIIVVSTSGEAVGQVNGLSVVDLGDTVFGQPSRITASIGVGREGVIDLQREARLAGPLHTKAVLTLQGFLVDRYATERPLTLAARLSFEQSYGPIEGDSATCAETCALLSRLADVPIKQSLAITGSMDQRGEVQAIGGVNYKIEGFYDVCRNAGLTGEQGVIIPASNVQHLVLREDVVEAVRQGRFHVYSISTIDEAVELLTGVEAGRRGEDGSYPPDSINGRVLAKLKHISEKLREHPPSPLEGMPSGSSQQAEAAGGMQA